MRAWPQYLEFRQHTIIHLEFFRDTRLGRSGGFVDTVIFNVQRICQVEDELSVLPKRQHKTYRSRQN